MAYKMSPAYYKYWGKAKKREDGSHEYHLLVYHCLDVAAVASVWFEQSKFIQKAFLNGNECTINKIKAWLLFFIALHDIGKMDLRFQLKVPQFIHDLEWDLIIRHGLSANDCIKYNHGTGGVYWLHNDLNFILGKDDRRQIELSNGESFTAIFNFDNDEPEWEVWKPWIESVCEHHGNIIRSQNVDDKYPLQFPKPQKTMLREDRKQLILVFEEVLLKPADLSICDTPPESSILLPGFCSICDWLGSNSTEKYFQFSREIVDPKEYFLSKRKDAETLLTATGLISCPKRYSGLGVLLKEGDKPRHLQTRIDELPLRQGLTIVEGPTGSGKTELALAYAWRLLENNLADSIVFALPSQATSNGMLPRLDKVAGVLFNDHPNLLLAHGNARFNKNFAEIRNRVNTIQGDADAAAQCSHWLSQSRKRALLGQIAVCTIDQVLMSVLPLKHGFVRQFCTGRSVLIVDEVHAYDQYMYGLLIEVLKKQKTAGVSAVLLSATLPGFQKEQLLESWCANHFYPKQDYPLITSFTTDGLQSFVLDKNEYPQKMDVKSVEKKIEQTETLRPSENLYNRISVSVKNGANVAVICNLVDDAQEIYYRLSKMIGDPAKIQLFHSRFTLNDRQKIEDKVIAQFGEDERRVRGKVLVATQVIEQSLNVDFDWMITQLCPVDLLFQRIGRLHRFELQNRPDGFRQPVCTVLAPADPFEYGTHGLIYQNTCVLWRTLRLLLDADSTMTFPHVYRPWVEKVYQEEPWKNEPRSITEWHRKYKDEIEFIKRIKARMMTESAMNPLDDNYTNAQIMTRDGELGVIITPFVQSGKGRKLLSGSLVEDANEHDKEELIYMNSTTILNSWWHWMKSFLENDKENHCWFEMEEAQKGEWGRNLDKYKIFYSKRLGLRKETCT